MSDWSAAQYSKFKAQRTLPAADLANSIFHENAKRVIDIGCGIGNSSAVLKNKFPNAEIIGADNSDDMLKAAKENYPDIRFIKIDANSELEKSGTNFDVVFSNACIQWIPNHERLLKNMMNLLSPNGVLAVQIPHQEKHPMHKLIKDVACSDKWSEKLTVNRIFNNLSEEEYFNLLSKISSDFRIWETTYFHAMPSHQSIVEWYKGTGLRPYLEQLSDTDKAEFEHDILTETEKVYPIQANREIIFKFPRLFFTARK